MYFWLDPEMGIPQSASWAEMVGRKKSSKELRALWRKAIMEQILLIRMEKENNSLKGAWLCDRLFPLSLSSVNIYICASEYIGLK